MNKRTLLAVALLAFGMTPVASAENLESAVGSSIEQQHQADKQAGKVGAKAATRNNATRQEVHHSNVSKTAGITAAKASKVVAHVEKHSVRHHHKK